MIDLEASLVKFLFAICIMLSEVNYIRLDVKKNSLKFRGDDIILHWAAATLIPC